MSAASNYRHAAEAARRDAQDASPSQAEILNALADNNDQMASLLELKDREIAELRAQVKRAAEIIKTMGRV